MLCYPRNDVPVQIARVIIPFGIFDVFPDNTSNEPSLQLVDESEINNNFEEYDDVKSYILMERLRSADPSKKKQLFISIPLGPNGLGLKLVKPEDKNSLGWLVQV